jgi:hypothetical protein
MRLVTALLSALMLSILLNVGDFGSVAASSDGSLAEQAQASAGQRALALSAPSVRPLVPSPLAPSPSTQVSPNQVGIRAKSAFEQTNNPFGDEWALKTTSNPSIPIGLTPVCPRVPGKPDADENRFDALSNSPILFTECVDLTDVSIPDGAGRVGSEQIKQSVAAIKALNPSVKYIAYFQAPRADTFIAGGAGKPVGLSFIDANHEDWFVHLPGQPATRANRVKYGNGVSDLYDVTKPDFRQYMVDAYVASLTYHGLDGFVLSDCLDQPFNAPSSPVSATISANWEAGCDALMQATKAALDPLGKLVFTFGFDHVATRNQGGAVNEAAAFAMFQRRMEITHGLFWEDPFRGVTVADSSAEGSLERYKRLRDYTTPRGKYLLTTNNTFEGGPSRFATTNAAQEKALARYYLASFLVAMSGPLTVNYHYFPTSVGEQFISNAYFKEWDLRVGNPLGADTKPAATVYQREFQNARVVANLSSSPFTVSLADSTYTNADGTPVGASAVVPAKSGAVFMRVIREVICTPRPAVRLTTAVIGSGQLRVTVLANGTGSPGNNSLLSIRFGAVANGVIDAGGQVGSPGNFTQTLATDATQTTFVLRRSATGATTVRFVVTDGCGDWPTFAGIGPGIP